MKEASDFEEPPFTLETAKEWLLRLDDEMYFARQNAFAAKFLLGNVVMRLHEANVMDTAALIGDLLTLCERLEPYEARAARGYLDELLEQLAAGSPPATH